MCTLARLSPAIAMVLACIACTGTSHSSGNHAKVVATLRPIELSASPETQAKFQSLFGVARSVEIRFVPLSQIEIRGYSPDIKAMPFSYVFQCGTLCPHYAGKLMARLQTARRAEGSCPWFTAALMFNSADGNLQSTRLLVDCTGRCIDIDGQLYILDAKNSLAYLFENSKAIFEY